MLVYVLEAGIPCRAKCPVEYFALRKMQETECSAG